MNDILKQVNISLKTAVQAIPPTYEINLLIKKSY